MKISVIVPVYNVEKYLAECLDSLLPALEQADELLLIQGSSTDTSREISLRYQTKCLQVTVLDQGGTGLSNARNCGLNAASGDYILFIDSDDFVDTAKFSDLLSCIRNDVNLADVWVTDYYKHFEASGAELLVEQIGLQDAEEINVLSAAFKGHRCFWNVWKNIYRRAFLIEHKLFFREETYAEDVDFITRLLLEEPIIRTASFPFYHYRVGRTGSLMNEITLKRIQDTVSVLSESICWLRNSKFKRADTVINGFQFEYLLNLALLCEISMPYQKEAQKTYQNYREILVPTTDPVVKICTIGMRLAGVKGMSRLLWFAKLIKRKKEHRTL